MNDDAVGDPAAVTTAAADDSIAADDGDRVSDPAGPEVLSGQWTATPQDSASACSVEQAPVTDAGVAPPQTTVGKPGQALHFEVVPVVFSIVLGGDCLWERVN